MIIIEVFIVIIGLTSISAFGSECQSLLNSIETKNVQDFLHIEENINSFWEPYQISKNPVVLFKLDTHPGCALLIQKDKHTVLISTQSILKITNGAYSFLINGQSMGTDNLSDLPSYLIAEGVQTALLWNLDFSWPTEIAKEYLLGTIVHEGFHLFAQRGNSIWPNWPTEKGQFSGHDIRASIMKTCYNFNRSISDLRKIEFESLSKSFKSAQIGDRLNALGNLKIFVESRQERYDQLKSIVIDLPNNQKMSCDDLEASFEFQEGIPEYASVMSLMKTGVLAVDEVMQLYSKTYGPSGTFAETYYSFGAFQLAILSMLSPDFKSIQNQLLHSTSPEEGLFIQIANLVGGKP